MQRLVLDSGPLIALVSAQDNYHEQCRAGFSKLPALFGEVLTPLAVLFEVYKFVSREQSPTTAQTVLRLVAEDTLVVLIGLDIFQEIQGLMEEMPRWQGSLEDASVVIVAQHDQANVWTLDYRDFGWFPSLELWTP